MEHYLKCPNDFWNIKIHKFDPYYVFLTIATNITQRLGRLVLWSRVTYINIYIKTTKCPNVTIYIYIYIYVELFSKTR